MTEYYRSKRAVKQSIHPCKQVKCQPVMGAPYGFFLSEPFWRQFLAQMDGFSVEMDINPQAQAHKVYVRPNQLLPMYTEPQLEKNSVTKRIKQYFFLITFPGEGAVACVCMESGCRNLGQDRGTLKFWWERIEEFGLPIPDDYPSHQAYRDEMKNHKWKVL